MNPLRNSFDTLHKPVLHFSHSSFLNYPLNFKPKFAFVPKPTTRRCQLTVKSSAVSSSRSAAAIGTYRVRNKQRIHTSEQKKVVVLWDLDNKPPRGPPYQAAMALKQFAQIFGDIVFMSAYSRNQTIMPLYVVQERPERTNLDILEREGIVTHSESYVCGVCGGKFRFNLDLKNHFWRFHERKRQNKLAKLRSLRWKSRQRYVRRIHKHNEAARSMVTPQGGYGLAAELRRAGVYLKRVKNNTQAAAWSLKRQLQHSGIDWLFLVSDNVDFLGILLRAKQAELGTVVVGDLDRDMLRHADLWVPWMRVENGEITKKNLVF